MRKRCGKKAALPRQGIGIPIEGSGVERSGWPRRAALALECLAPESVESDGRGANECEPRRPSPPPVPPPACSITQHAASRPPQSEQSTAPSQQPWLSSLAPIARTLVIRARPDRRGERGRKSVAGRRDGRATRWRGGGRSGSRGWHCATFSRVSVAGFDVPSPSWSARKRPALSLTLPGTESRPRSPCRPAPALLLVPAR